MAAGESRLLHVFWYGSGLVESMRTATVRDIQDDGTSSWRTGGQILLAQPIPRYGITAHWAGCSLVRQGALRLAQNFVIKFSMTQRHHCVGSYCFCSIFDPKSISIS